MDNQRRTPNSPSTFNRNSNFRKSGDKPTGYSKYPSRDNKFQPRGERFQRNDRSEGFQRRDDRFGKRPGGKFPPRNDRFQGKDRFAPKGKTVPAWKTEPKIKIVSDLQITDGRLRGKYLQNSTSPKMKVTSRRVREAVFKILFRRIRARRFLDLCAGAGMIGLEAVSRGSIVSSFVERSPKMCSFIRKNMESLEVKTGHGEIFEIECLPFLKQMSKRRRFWDVVYYSAMGSPDLDEALRFFGRGIPISPGGTLVIEHAAEIFLPERVGVMKRWRVVVQGDVAISFFERR